MHHHEAADAPGREGDHEDEEDPRVDEPGVGEQAHPALQEHHQDRADHRAREDADATDVGHEQGVGGHGAAHGVVGDDLVGERVECARDPGEEAGERELDEANHARVVADELGALEVVAAGVGHAPERGAGEQQHERHRDRGPDDDEIVDLDGRRIAHADQAAADHAVGAHPALAPEEGLEHQRTGRDQLPDAEGDHGEGGGPLLGREVAEEDREGETAEATGERGQLEGDRERPALGRVERVRGHVAAQAQEHRVAEGEQPGLAHLHVVAEREDDHDAHLAQHRHDEAGVPPGRPVEGEPRHDQSNRERGEPRPLAAEPARDAFRGDRVSGGADQSLAHVSRVPMSPRGLTSSTRISIR